MDLNEQYAAHQRAMMRASASPLGIARTAQLWLASTIASEIGNYQETLGAAASCAWSAASLSSIRKPAAALPAAS